MLDGLKPIAEFSLALNCHFYKGLLDIDGMNIKDLLIFNNWHSSEEKFLLPLWKSKDKSIIDWSDLAPLCKNLVTLTVITTKDIFRSRWIPETIKYLQLINRFGKGYARGKLIVPSGVNYLHILDRFEFRKRRVLVTSTASIIVCVDLSRARQLERIWYEGCDGSNQLIRTLLQVKDTLEWLSIECEEVTDLSTYEFRVLARQGLRLKRLKLTMGSFGKKLSDYQDFLTDFPELRLLEIKFNELYDHFYLLAEDCKINFIKGLTASFLHGSPKLSHIQVQSSDDINWIDSSLPCVTRDGSQGVIYDVDVCEARIRLGFERVE
ncbi:hypothetical protein TRVA0_039S00276 [Trichomonascus vanleenenianus]|uniref:uncharacterized protein n=1 Tax=Trichomonascus vanleenenianus TaxID=2268995 RepID=UPI003ECA2289